MHWKKVKAAGARSGLFEFALEDTANLTKVLDKKLSNIESYIENWDREKRADENGGGGSRLTVNVKRNGRSSERMNASEKRAGTMNRKLQEGLIQEKYCLR